MDTDLSVFGPVVPLVECQSQQHSQSSFPAASLDPEATIFAPEPSKGDNATAIKMAALSIAEVPSSPTSELTDPALQIVDEGIHFMSAKDTFTFSCSTQNVPRSSEGFNIVTKLVAAASFPRKVQLFIFTGPRLQRINKAAMWFVESLGPYIRTVHQVQLVIVRCGEYVSGKWVIPELDLEKFNPFLSFLSKFLGVISKHVDIIWGASDDLALALRKHYVARAVPGQQSAFEKEKDKGADSYSEVISSATLNDVASKYMYLLGASSGTVTSRTSMLNPKAQSFVPMSAYCKGTSMFTPSPGNVDTLPIVSHVPLNKQFYGAHTSHHDWVPSVWDNGSQYDETRYPQYTYNHNNMDIDPMVFNHMAMSTNMYPGYNAPLRAPIPAYSANPTGCHPHRSSNNDTPMYATASQYAQQGFDKKNREEALNKGDKKPHAYNFHSGVGVNHRQHFPRSNFDGRTSHNRKDNSYSRGPGNEYGSYAPAHGISGKLGAGRGYVNDGADKRNPSHNSKLPRHKAKSSKYVTLESQGRQHRPRYQDRYEHEFGEETVRSRTHYPATSMNTTGGFSLLLKDDNGALDVSKTISDGGFAVAATNADKKDKDHVGGGAQTHDHGLE